MSTRYRDLLTLSIAFVVLGACSSSGDDASPEPPATSTTVIVAPTATEPAGGEQPVADPAYVVRRVTTGGQPCGVLGAAGHVWVSNYGDNTLVAVDPRTGKVGDPIAVGSSPCGLAYGAGSIWVENYGSNDVTRVDARSQRVQDTIAVGSAPYDVTFAAGAAWVTNYTSASVTRIDADTGRAIEIRVGGTPVGVAPAGDGVWVAVGTPGLVKLDPATGAVLDRVHLGGVTGWTAYDADSLWVGVDDTVVQVDGATDEVRRRIEVGAAPLDGDVLGSTVWVPDQSGELYRVGVGDGRVTRPLDSAVGTPFVIAGYQGLVWAVDYSGSDVVAIDPGKAP